MSSKIKERLPYNLPTIEEGLVYIFHQKRLSIIKCITVEVML